MRNSLALTICRVALLWAAGISVLFPVLWIALASLKSPEQLNDPFLLSFALSIDDFIITYFVSGPSTTTFPVRIFGQSRTATPPQINVLASMILFGSIIVLAIGTLLGQRRERRLNAAP